MTATTANSKPLLTRSLTVLLAVAGGAAVGNLYWAQPLLGQIAHDLSVSTTTAGLLVTMTQIGYALGILLVVPLGDFLSRRWLIPTVMSLSVLALVASAKAPSFVLLAMALGFVGLSSIAGQIIAPLVGDLASPENRGAALGVVASGILTGILVSRTLSGLIAMEFGWRAVYISAAFVDLVLVLLLTRFIPTMKRRESIPYAQLITSVFTTSARIPAVPRILLINGAVFGVFNLFWTALTFLLSSKPYSYSTLQIGLVGLAGLAGALAVQRVGRLADRGLGVPATGAFILLTLASLLVSLPASHSIWVVIGVAVVLDVGVQGTSVLNQARLLSLSEEARSRLAAAFVTNNFVSAAAGSALASVLWNLGGWSAIAIGGAVWVALGFGIWMSSRSVLGEAERSRAGAREVSLTPIEG